MKYVAYYRVSTDQQGRSGLGLKAQQTDVHNYLADNGGELLAEFEEVASGRRLSRPKLQAALSLCRVHGAALVVAKLDRLSRNAAAIEEILSSNVQVIFLDVPSSSSGAVSLFMVQQMAVMAQLESDLISQRTKDALQAAKARGVKLGGDRGYRPTRESILKGAEARRKKADAHAADLALIVRDIINSGHASLARIAKELERRGIPTPSRTGSWKPTMVSRLLKRMEAA